jgi:hypothetical protein
MNILPITFSKIALLGWLTAKVDVCSSNHVFTIRKSLFSTSSFGQARTQTSSPLSAITGAPNTGQAINFPPCASVAVAVIAVVSG